MVNSTSLANVQFLFACHYINAFGIWFSNKDLIANNEQNQTELTWNALLQYLSKSNESDAKYHLPQKRIEQPRLYHEGKIIKIDKKYANITNRYIINSALFYLYKNIAQFSNGIDKNFTAFKQTVLQHLLKGIDVCSFENFSSKLTAETISKIYDYILTFFIKTENFERNSNGQRKKLKILKRFTRQTGRKGNDVERRIPDFQNENDDNDMFMDVPAASTEILTLPEGFGMKSHDDNYGEPEFNQALLSLASRKYGNDLTEKDAIEAIENVRNSYRKVGVNIKDASHTASKVERWREDFLGGDEDYDFHMDGPSGSRKIPTETEDIGINVIQKIKKNVEDDSNIAAKVRKIDIIDDNSLSTVEDEDPSIRFAETSKETSFKSPDIIELFAKGNMDYSFLNTLRILRDLGLSVLKQYENILKQFRIDLNNFAIEQANHPGAHEQQMELWFRQTTDRPNIVEFLRDLEFGIFFFNDVTLLRKISGAKPWEAFSQSSVDSPDERFTVYYYVTINTLSGFVHLHDYETFEDFYITFPDVKFVVLQADFFENTNTLVMKLMRLEQSESDYVFNRREDLKVLNSEEKVKTKRLKAIEKAAEMISANVPMKTFRDTVETLKKYFLKLEESETPVPTYDKLAKDYCKNLEVPSHYENWTIPQHNLINNVLFYTYFDDEITHENFKKLPFYAKRKYPGLHNVYKNSSTMQKSARVEDFLNLYKFINPNFYVGVILSNPLLISLCVFALRQSEDSIAIPKTLYYLNYVKDSFRKSNRFANFTNDFAVFTSELIDINNLSSIDSSLRNPQLISLKLQNNAGLVNLDAITGNKTGKYIIAPGMTFEVNSFRQQNTKNESVMIVNLWNNRTEERNMIDIIKRLYELLNL